MKAKALKEFLNELTNEELEYEICYYDESINKPYYTNDWNLPVTGKDDKAKIIDLYIKTEHEIN